MLHRSFFIIFVVAILASACVRYDLDEVLLSREDVSLTWKGKTQIVYEPATWQMACNDERNEYRVNDDEMANYFIIKCMEKPSYEGQELQADVEWTLKTNIKKFEGIRFEVKKIADDGCIWLWCRSQKIGVTVKRLN